MDDVAIGVKVFSRHTKLEKLLKSIEQTPIKKVYVADDGNPSQSEKKVYERDYTFDLTVLDLEYDAGLGYGRKQIVEQMDEEYLLVVDSDHKIPQNVDILWEQLKSRSDLGGVSGLFFENGTISGGCHDFYKEGDILIRDIRSEKPLQMCAGAPLLEFEFIPNAALFRRQCLNDYCWDENYVIGYEHEDFYVGHKFETDWKFAVSPSVLFDHDPGGDANYMSNRWMSDKHLDSKNYFLEKWDLDDILWVDVFPPNYHYNEVVANQFLLDKLPHRLQIRAIRILRHIKNASIL